MCFVEGAIGVPAVALINWGDDFIHSSDDDLDKIDQTQLQRNNFFIGSMAYYLASAEDADVPLIAGETFSPGSQKTRTRYKGCHGFGPKRKQWSRGWMERCKHPC